MDLEYAEYGEIYSFVARLGAFPETIARFYFKQLIDGLNTIHQAGIVHRDLKLENILIGKGYNLKIADFGLSCEANEHEDGLLYDKKGTTAYMAPE